MHLLFPQLWSCTCGDDFICRHQMAVFFSFYGEVGSVMEWVEDWKKSRRPPLPQELNIKRASEVFAERMEEVTLEKSYSAYKEFVTSSFSEQIESDLQVPPYIMENRLQQYLNYIGKKEPLSGNGSYCIILRRCFVRFCEHSNYYDFTRMNHLRYVCFIHLQPI